MSALRISTNTSALSAQRSLSRASEDLGHALRALASGQRIVNAGDDAAGFAIGESLKAQISGAKQSKMNAANAISLIQVAEGSLNEQDNILIRLRELGVQAASDTIGDVEREYLNQEFVQLVEEFDRIAKTTSLGNQPLLSGRGGNFEFQVGAFNDATSRISYSLDADTTASNVGIADLQILDTDEARDALEIIDEALKNMSTARASFGAIQSRLQIAQNHAEVHHENLSEARSRIVDADIAEESMNLARSQILMAASTSVLAQANQETSRVLKLLA